MVWLIAIYIFTAFTFTAIPKPGVGHTIQLCNIFII